MKEFFNFDNNLQKLIFFGETNDDNDFYKLKLIFHNNLIR